MKENNEASIAIQDAQTDNRLVEEMILNSMVEGVITLECSGKVHTANPSALKALGLEEDQAIGADIHDLMAKDGENQEFYDIFRQIMNQAAPTYHKEVRYTRPDGQALDLSVSASFINVDECVPGLQDVVVVFRDITAFKSIELMRRRAVDHLSHELKTPLSVIQATVQTFLNKDRLDEKQLRKFQRIQRHLKRLTELQEVVEEILNPRPYNPQKFNVKKLLGEILSNIRAESSFRNVGLSASLPDVVIDFVDPEILELSMATLVKNAVENSPESAEVGIRAVVDEKGLYLEVEDRGIGIPLMDREFIFDGFHHTLDTDLYQSKKPYEFGAGGKGLELLRLKTLSEEHPLEINFQSERCSYIPTGKDLCPGSVDLCEHVKEIEGCRRSGGSRFTVRFLQ